MAGRSPWRSPPGGQQRGQPGGDQPEVRQVLRPGHDEASSGDRAQVNDNLGGLVLLRLGACWCGRPGRTSGHPGAHQGQGRDTLRPEHAEIVLDWSAMVSERLLDQLQHGQLHAAVIHQVPALAAMGNLGWEPLRRGRLAVLASPGSTLALRQAVALGELSGHRFLVNPRSLRPPSRASS